MMIRINRGFSLVELAISMAVVAVLSAAILPCFINKVQEKAAEKTITEIKILQLAARNYFIKNKKWPENEQLLKAQGYIETEWQTKNPWSNPYEFKIKGDIFSVSTEVPAEWILYISRSLPQSMINGVLITSSINVLNQEDQFAKGIIVSWSGSIASIPDGWWLCDGTHGTPDLRDKFVIGASVDQDGIAKTGVMDGQLKQQGGSTQHDHSGITGDHVLTLDEMPRHQHSSIGEAFVEHAKWGVDPNFGRGQMGLANSDWDNYMYMTSWAGGNQAHNHEIAKDYHVPPFFALAYIMKI